MAVCVVLLAIGAGTGSCFAGSLSVKLVDATGASIPGMFVFLQSESDASRRSRGWTDNDGAYKFLDLPAGNFRLEVISTTFSNKSIRVVELPAEEDRVLSSIELQVGLFSGCDSQMLHLQDGSILASTADTGDLAGTFVNKKDKPIANVVVELSCGDDQICGQARTNSKGEFLFRGLKPGYYSVIAKGARHYPLTKAGFVVRAGLRLTYGSIELESCVRGDCDPAHKPKDLKFLGPICED